MLEERHSHNIAFQIAFDAIWTLAQVLNYTEMMREAESDLEFEYMNCSSLSGELVPLHEFNYSNALMGCVMKENYYKVHFTGVSVSEIDVRMCVGII